MATENKILACRRVFWRTLRGIWAVIAEEELAGSTEAQEGLWSTDSNTDFQVMWAADRTIMPMKEIHAAPAVDPSVESFICQFS